MKIDEPKTPYVTDEEFKKLCDEDEEYQKAVANARKLFKFPAQKGFQIYVDDFIEN